MATGKYLKVFNSFCKYTPMGAKGTVNRVFIFMGMHPHFEFIYYDSGLEEKRKPVWRKMTDGIGD